MGYIDYALSLNKTVSPGKSIKFSEDYMGKIYDALKRAEKEAQINREKPQFADNERLSNRSSHSVIKKDDQQETTNLYHERSHIVKVRGDGKKAPAWPSISETIPRTRGNTIRDFAVKIFKSDTKQRIRKNLFVAEDSTSIAAEQFRIIKSRILSCCKENNLRTMLITSCLPGEGKSTVSANLALSIANGINEHALLLDCDLRRPAIHKLFNLVNGKGLAEYLDTDIPLKEILIKSKSEKLTIIPAGNIPHNPSELLSSTKMSDLINELKSKYADRYIIFDSTPAYQTPEPVILAKQIDCIILVIKAGNTNRELIKRIVDSLPKKKIIGVVFNMVNEPIKSYYYSTYYSKQNS